MFVLAILYFLCGIIAGFFTSVYMVSWTLHNVRSYRVQVCKVMASRYPDEYLEAEESLSCEAEEIHGDNH